MDSQEKKGPEPDLYQTDSGLGQVTQIHNLREFESVPGIWSKVHTLTEKMGAETIGVEQLPEEARNSKQKPRSKSLILLFFGIVLMQISRHLLCLDHGQLPLFGIHDGGFGTFALWPRVVGFISYNHLL